MIFCCCHVHGDALSKVESTLYTRAALNGNDYHVLIPMPTSINNALALSHCMFVCFLQHYLGTKLQLLQTAINICVNQVFTEHSDFFASLR